VTSASQVTYAHPAGVRLGPGIEVHSCLGVGHLDLRASLARGAAFWGETEWRAVPPWMRSHDDGRYRSKPAQF
jgi:hypothetical protein